jgi:hypothetical protein
VSPPVLLPAVLVVLGANRTILSVRDSRDPVCGNAQIRQEILGRGGSPITQAEVILLTSSLVTVALDRELDVGIRLEEIGIPG